MRDLVRLVCTECKEENYYTDKNKKLNPERIEMKKYCPRCNKKTAHKEKKQYMKIDKLILGEFKTNCYVVSHNNTAFVIDPACNGETIDAFLRKNNYQLKAIFLTHGHPDHIGAVDYLYNLYFFTSSIKSLEI